MTARGWHTLGAALLSGVLVVILSAIGFWNVGPRSARPGSSSAQGGAAAAPGDNTALDEPGGAPGPGGGGGRDGAGPTGQETQGGALADGGGRPPTTQATNGPGDRQPVNTAQRLRTLPAQTRQVVIVTTDTFASNTAVLETHEKVDGRWRQAFAPMSARIGQAGFADRKAEGDLKTPTGMYPLEGTMYGIAANPGVKYNYHQLVQDDWWNENPSSPGYNSFFHGPNPGGASEALWTISPQYRYFTVINYNFPVVPANPPLGSGIFLHVMNPGKATAGCVSLAESDLLAVLRWLDPASAPRMVLTPRTVLSRY